jgi:ubiquinone/menaquinone biosynthesis C-methylase UbiE
VFNEFSAEPVRRVLDLGCGTGGHAIALGRHGYELIGVDRSPAMLAVGQAKAESDVLSELHNYDATER